MSDIVKGIALFGRIEDSPECWRRWVDYAEKVGACFGFPASHLDVEGDSFRGGKALKLGRARMKLSNAVDRGESFEAIGFFSVPDDFSTLIFDYSVYVYRCLDFIATIVDAEVSRSIELSSEINALKLHLAYKGAELFEVSREELVFGYLSGEDGLDDYDSLRVLKRFNGGRPKRRPSTRPPAPQPPKRRSPAKKQRAVDKKKAREQLVHRINAQEHASSDDPAPVVTLEDFFEGNDDEGSIGCNLPDHPGVDRFYAVLKRVRGRKNVQDVLVEISDVDDEPAWPFSERVYILTNASTDDVEDWLSELQPDEVDEGFAFGVPKAAPKPKRGMRVVNAWWD